MIEMHGAFHAFAAIGTDAPETLEILYETGRLISENAAPDKR